VLAYAFVVAYQSDPWSVLGDGSRRAIVERLSVGACTVADLAGEMPISRPAVSQHLKVLKDAGVVQDRVSGRHRVYSLDAERLGRFRRQLDQFWSDAFTHLAATIDEQERGAG
jgi:DNA-binding transcriptional ArsR family regulator